MSAINQRLEQLNEANNQRRLLVNEVLRLSGGKLGLKAVEQQIGPIDYNTPTKKKEFSVGGMSFYVKQQQSGAEFQEEQREREELAQKIVDELLK